MITGNHNGAWAKRYLAFDLGATSGRAFVGSLRSGILTLNEIHRFLNEPLHCGSAWHWDVARIWAEVQNAFASLEPTKLDAIGLDAWGVDYALLGADGALLESPHHYRDPRNISAMKTILAVLAKEEIYRRTGIQFMPINTLNQLFAAKRDNPELLSAAKTLLMIPDLFRYWMTGQVACEFTAASTTQFADPSSRSWDRGLLDFLGLPGKLPADIVEPGCITGALLPAVSRDPGLAGTPVVAPASHDTASAVAAIEARNGTVFLSSGTWSLVGTELTAPLLSSEALRLNFTNEGGISGTTRLLKNVMGLWMLECCRRACAVPADSAGYDELLDSAMGARAFRHLVNPDEASFLNPADMTHAIDQFCRKTDQPVPDSPASYARSVLESLALKYRLVIGNLEQLTAQPIDKIRVIGGGSRNRILNQFTADATGKVVIAGPAEAAVLGNIGVQMMATGAAGSLKEMRNIIDRSFPTEVFTPQDTHSWDVHAERFSQYCEFSYA